MVGHVAGAQDLVIIFGGGVGLDATVLEHHVAHEGKALFLGGGNLQSCALAHIFKRPDGGTCDAVCHDLCDLGLCGGFPAGEVVGGTHVGVGGGKQNIFDGQPRSGGNATADVGGIGAVEQQVIGGDQNDGLTVIFKRGGVCLQGGVGTVCEKCLKLTRHKALLRGVFNLSKSGFHHQNPP